ncbi:hypothetical protein DERF_010609 [Dermatophagoides farinae]|uniref:Uncharacterized protein n=1 Tax=Dermatophagoides farinae TaxID=6954 RepID=A0A922L0U7_DERFA|nr:hypothetical protein DERF_010609 [Dermatophagoides farinae]
MAPSGIKVSKRNDKKKKSTKKSPKLKVLEQRMTRSKLKEIQNEQQKQQQSQQQQQQSEIEISEPKESIPRNQVLLTSLPKFVFNIPGSQTIWNDIIGFDIDDEIRKKFHHLLKDLDAMQKSILAKCIVDHGIESVMANSDIMFIDDDDDDDKQINMQNMPILQPRCFINIATQTTD